MNNKKRRHLELLYDCLYDMYCPNEDERDFCFYCGVPADTRDHVPALNCVESIRAEYINPDTDIIYQKVFACRECNSMASDKRHLDIWERKDWLKKALFQKYKKDIEQIDWYEEDFHDCGEELSRQMKARMKRKYTAIARILFGENTTFFIDDLGYLPFDPILLERYVSPEAAKNVIRIVNHNNPNNHTPLGGYLS